MHPLSRPLSCAPQFFQNHTQSLTKMYSMTLCQHHHKPNLITLWGIPVNSFLYFCRPIVIDSDRSALAQDTIGVVTISFLFSLFWEPAPSCVVFQHKYTLDADGFHLCVNPYITCQATIIHSCLNLLQL